MLLAPTRNFLFSILIKRAPFTSGGGGGGICFVPQIIPFTTKSPKLKANNKQRNDQLFINRRKELGNA